MYKILKGFTWSMVSKVKIGYEFNTNFDTKFLSLGKVFLFRNWYFQWSLLMSFLSFRFVCFSVSSSESAFILSVCASLRSFPLSVLTFPFPQIPCLLEDDVIDFKLKREVTLNELDTSEKHCIGSTRSSGTWV